jgi:hypothetical protein
MTDPNQERIDAHLDEWDNLSELEQYFINESARLLARERATWARYFATLAERAAAVDAEAEAIMTEQGW